MTFFRKSKEDPTEPKTGSKGSSMNWPVLLGLAFSKGKLVLGTLLKMKGLMSFLSMLVSVLAYWWTMNLGLPGALLFVALLFVHEMGHALVLRYYGIKASLPMFIPFMGAFIGIKELPNSASKEAAFALGGPILGSIAALACLPMWYLTGSNLWLWGASVGFMLNLFNLIPVSPLDGGRIVGAVWRGFWFLGLGVLGGLAVTWHSSFMALILLIGVSELNDRYSSVSWLVYAAIAGVALVLGGMWMDIGFGLVALFGALLAAMTYKYGDRRSSEENEQKAGRSEAYFNVPIKLRIIIGVTYLSLAGTLGALLYWVHTLNVFH